MKTIFLFCIILFIGLSLTSVQGDICLLSKKVGPCRARFPRFYFNSKTRRCERFYYGGCAGNANNFLRAHHCQRACKKHVQGDICLLPKKVGPCRARFPRFYFNSKTRRCERFYYGGCAGNANNFLRAHHCQRACKKHVQGDICLLPKKIGPCLALFPRYYFNSKSRRCERFYYGGCAGNANNFLRVRQCQRACKKHVQGIRNICLLPKKIGPCRARFPRYYFNSQSRRCERFYYGGCAKNANNFFKISDCRRACM